MPDNKPGKKSKRYNKGPSRIRYWLSRRLEKKKIKMLMKHCGLTKEAATKRWHHERKGRVPDGYLYNKGADR